MAGNDSFNMVDSDALILAEGKFGLLTQALRQYERIAVAFSGGVDSTLMLYAALDALGPAKVIALYAVSPLNPAESVAASRTVFARNFPQNAVLREVEVTPLFWQEFVKNDKERCYYCKKRMYAAMQEAMTVMGCSVLADGTNGDDRQEGRPGLRALLELQIITPLADVGLTKKEVRLLAERFGLSNYNLPSNSCLATRIPENTPITAITLRVIAVAEEFLHDRGYLGCRVRVQPSSVIVEVRERDVAAFMEQANRVEVQTYFHSLQLGPVALSLKGR
jgi:uncharacterized protein